MSGALSGARFRQLVGRRLAEARLAGSLPLREVAERAAVHPNDVLRWESGGAPAPAAYVAFAAELFDVSSDWLLGRSEEPRPTAAVPSDAVPLRLLREAVTLTHPDLHSETRRERATRVTQELNALADRRS